MRHLKVIYWLNIETSEYNHQLAESSLSDGLKIRTSGSKLQDWYFKWFDQ